MKAIQAAVSRQGELKGVGNMQNTMVRQLFIDLDLTAPSELTVLRQSAEVLARRFNLDVTGVHASLLASEVKGAHFVAADTALIYASGQNITTPQLVGLNLSQPVRWGDTDSGQAVSHLLALLIPNAYGSEAAENLVAQVARRAQTAAWPLTSVSARKYIQIVLN